MTNDTDKQAFEETLSPRPVRAPDGSYYRIRVPIGAESGPVAQNGDRVRARLEVFNKDMRPAGPGLISLYGMPYHLDEGGGCDIDIQLSVRIVEQRSWLLPWHSERRHAPRNAPED